MFAVCLLRIEPPESWLYLKTFELISCPLACPPASPKTMHWYRSPKGADIGSILFYIGWLACSCMMKSILAVFDRSLPVYRAFIVASSNGTEVVKRSLLRDLSTMLMPSPSAGKCSTTNCSFLDIFRIPNNSTETGQTWKLCLWRIHVGITRWRRLTSFY